MTATFLAWLASAWGVAISVLTLLGLLIASVYWKRIEALYTPHVDWSLHWFLSWLPSRFRPAQIEHPTETPLPDPPKTESKPIADAAPFAERRIRSTIPFESFLPHIPHSQNVEYDFSWAWSDDDVVDLKVHCPMCGKALAAECAFEGQRGNRESTRLTCAKCGFSASVRTPLPEFEMTAKQAIYLYHRRLGLL